MTIKCERCANRTTCEYVSYDIECDENFQEVLTREQMTGSANTALKIRSCLCLRICAKNSIRANGMTVCFKFSTKQIWRRE